MAYKPIKMLSSREKQLLTQLRSNKHPNVAEDGKGFFVLWADGRGQVGYKRKNHAIAFIEQGDRDALSAVYRKREKGETVRNIFSPDKSSVIHNMLFKESETKREHRKKVVINDILFVEAEERLNKSLTQVIDDKVNSGYQINFKTIQAAIRELWQDKLKENNLDRKTPEDISQIRACDVHYAKLYTDIKKWGSDRDNNELTSLALSLVLKNLTDHAADKVKNIGLPAPQMTTPTIPEEEKTMVKKMPDNSQQYLQKRKNIDRRLFREQPRRLGSIEDRLLKAANRLDEHGESRVADKIDLLLQKLCEVSYVRKASRV